MQCSRTVVWVGVLGMAVSLSACSSGWRSASRAHHVDGAKYLRQHRIEKLEKTQIPLVVNDRVVAWMDYFQGPGRHHFTRYMERSGRYLPEIQRILKEEGMPPELAYIALIESGFNTRAVSHAAAVGPWQFIRGTGKRYGMGISPWVDERRDIEKSTRAAAAYFRDLYAEFGDWYLAMASYNTGEGRVRRAVANAGSRDFWTLARQKLLHPETRDYVPKYIAAAIIARQPEKFGFTNINYQNPLRYDVVTVDSQADLDVIAKCANADVEELRDLNPHLVRQVTPPSGPYQVRVPEGRAKQFEIAFAAIPPDQRVRAVSVAYHTVRRGDTLPKIARRYGVSVAKLAEANDIGRSRKLHAGQQLVIPSKFRSDKAYAAASGEGASVRSQNTVHRVRSGDTLSKVAKRHGVTVAQLAQWNRLNTRAPLRVGQQLRITKASSASAQGAPKQAAHKSQPESAQKAAPTNVATATPALQQYRVRRGDTLWNIAKQHGVSVAQLQETNGLRSPSAMRPGKVLSIPVVQ